MFENQKTGLKMIKTDSQNRITELARIIRVKNHDSYVLSDTSGNTLRLNAKELSEWTILIPDGYLTFNIVDMSPSIRDVIVALYRYEDIKRKEGIPYAIARQLVENVFATYAVPDASYHKTYVGCSMTVDTCPANVDYSMMSACNHVRHSFVVNVYLDDNLDNIYKLCKHMKTYNEVFSINYNRNKDNSRLSGYFNSLIDFLKYHEFEDDFLRSFNIITLEDIEIKSSDITTVGLSLSKELGKKITHLECIPYSRSINRDIIDVPYVIVRDTAKKYYLIKYLDDGFYNPHG